MTQTSPKRRQHRYPAQLPRHFDPGFLAKIDKRFRPAINCAATIEELRTALAEDDLSPQKKIVVQRIAWAHQRLQELEGEYASGHGFDAATWVSLTNVLFIGLKMLGLHRRAKTLPRALEYAAQVAKETRR